MISKVRHPLLLLIFGLILTASLVSGCSQITEVNAQANLKNPSLLEEKAYKFTVLANGDHPKAVTLKCGFNWVVVHPERKLSVEFQPRDDGYYLIISGSQARVNLDQINSSLNWELIYLGSEKLYIADSDFFIQLGWKDLEEVIRISANICQ